MRSGITIAAVWIASLFMGGIPVSYATAHDVAQPQIIFQAPNLVDRQTVQDMLKRLLDDGYIYIEVYLTELGNARFVAFSPALKREMTINLDTGEILSTSIEENSEGLHAPSSTAATGNSTFGNWIGGEGFGNADN